MRSVLLLEVGRRLGLTQEKQVQERKTGEQVVRI